MDVRHNTRLARVTRFFYAIVTLAIFTASFPVASLTAAQQYTHKTPNFTVTTSSPEMAREFALQSEQLRRQLAIDWTGKEMPRWWQPAIITVTVGENLSGGGQTMMSFDQDRREVYGWRMSIQGSRDRVLDSVLPHEITHMVFASHFRTPVPRWADEGGAVSTECMQEQLRHRKMLLGYLSPQSRQGIPTSTLLQLTDYPANNVLAFYAQSFSLTEFLLQHGGRQKFLRFVGDGIQSDDWSDAVRSHYGHDNLTELQSSWVSWVNSGFPPINQIDDPPTFAPETAIAADDTIIDSAVMPVGFTTEPLATDTATNSANTLPERRSVYEPSWQVRTKLAAERGSSTGLAPTRDPLSPPTTLPRLQPVNRSASPQASSVAGQLRPQPIAGTDSRIRFLPSAPSNIAASAPPTQHARPTQVSRPLPPQRPSQVILEWSRF